VKISDSFAKQKTDPTHRITTVLNPAPIARQIALEKIAVLMVVAASAAIVNKMSRVMMVNANPTRHKIRATEYRMKAAATAIN